MATGSLYQEQSKNNLLTNKNEETPVQSFTRYKEPTGTKDILTLSQETSPDRVYEIDQHASKLTRIQNFEKFTKLRCVDLSCNEIENIKALEKNVELKELKLYSNKITKIEGLGKLKELCSLQLQDNSISNIGPGLQNLKKLKTLRVDCNKIFAIAVSEIAACSKLTYLDVSSNKLSDISFINCLPSLEEFYASHNELVKIPDLGRCKKLQEIDVSHNTISSIAGIRSLPSIKIIRLGHNSISKFDISGLVPTLEELYVDNNQISSFKRLPFPSIEVLDISSNTLDNTGRLCKDLSHCDMLRELNISDNLCYDPELFDHQTFLKALPKLEVLNGNPVKRPQSSYGRTRPPMRPVSASQMVSTKQMEEQVLAAIQQQNSFESMIASKFDVVYCLLKKLPDKGNHQSEVSKKSSDIETSSLIESNTVHDPSSELPISGYRDTYQSSSVHHQSGDKQISVSTKSTQLSEVADPSSEPQIGGCEGISQSTNVPPSSEKQIRGSMDHTHSWILHPSSNEKHISGCEDDSRICCVYSSPFSVEQISSRPGALESGTGSVHSESSGNSPKMNHDFLKRQDSSRPSSRCSNRARLRDAITFASQNFDE